MGLFGTKKTEPAQVAAPKKEKAPLSTKARISATSVLVKPRITEKAANLLERNIYTFEITKGASKYDVRDAVKSLYNVTPSAIRIVNKKPRHYMSKARGRDMMESGLRKAYVYLKKGDRIDLV
jgi:large subunit ribosomal protein L23